MNTVFSSITVDKVEESFGKNQAQIRQIVEKQYPKIRLNNSLNDALIPSQLVEGEMETYQEIRVAWATVGNGTKEEDVKASLDQMPNARIYKILSNEVILSDSDENWMNQLSEEDKKDFLEKKKAAQLVTSSDGEIIKDIWGQYQYRRNAFTADYTAVEGLNEACVMDLRKDMRENIQIPRVSMNPNVKQDNPVHVV